MDRLTGKNKYHFFNKLTLALCLLLSGLLSCGDEYLLDNVDCSECYVPKPEYGPVSITLSPDSENARIPVKIFKGKYTEQYRTDFSSAVVVDTISTSNYTVDLKVNEYYSVAAEYMKDGKKILAVDGDRLKIYRVSDNCDEVCWIFRGGKIDVSLKK